MGRRISLPRAPIDYQINSVDAKALKQSKPSCPGHRPLLSLTIHGALESLGKSVKRKRKRKRKEKKEMGNTWLIVTPLSGPRLGSELGSVSLHKAP
jgi:hypothetical protein